MKTDCFYNLGNFKQFAVREWRTLGKVVDSQQAAAGFYNGSEFTSNDIKGKETPTEEWEFKY